MLGFALSCALAAAAVEPTVSIDGQALKAARVFTVGAALGTEVQFATAPVECGKVRSGYALMEGDVPLVVTLAPAGEHWRVVEVVFEHVRIRLKDDESRASRAPFGGGGGDSFFADDTISVTASCRRRWNLCCYRLRGPMTSKVSALIARLNELARLRTEEEAREFLELLREIPLEAEIIDDLLQVVDDDTERREIMSELWRVLEHDYPPSVFVPALLRNLRGMLERASESTFYLHARLLNDPNPERFELYVSGSKACHRATGRSCSA